MPVIVRPAIRVNGTASTLGLTRELDLYPEPLCDGYDFRRTRDRGHNRALVLVPRSAFHGTVHTAQIFRIPPVGRNKLGRNSSELGGCSCPSSASVKLNASCHS
jgi:hypothetical protein